MKRILFLDDDLDRHRKVKSHMPYDAVYTAVGAIEKLSTKQYDIVFLDHDLGGRQMVDSNEEETGYTVAKWIAANKPVIEFIVVHSLNHGGSANMISVLRRAEYECQYIPFTSLLPVLHECIA